MTKGVIMKRLALLVLLLLALVLVGCGGEASAPLEPTAAPATATRLLSCAEEYPEYFEALGDALDEYSDAMDIMFSVSKLAVAGPIGDMQDVQRSVEKLDAPACGVTAQHAVADYMDAEITFWLTVLSDDFGPGPKGERAMQSARAEVDEKGETAVDAVAALHIK
jgi:hypothetical protein